jgi:hypothetical protein
MSKIKFAVSYITHDMHHEEMLRCYLPSVWTRFSVELPVLHISTWQAFRSVERTTYTFLAVWSVVVSCLKGTGSVVLGHVRNIWCQNICNVSVWIYGLRKKVPIIPVAHIAHHIKTLTSCNGTSYQSVCNIKVSVHGLTKKWLSNPSVSHSTLTSCNGIFCINTGTWYSVGRDSVDGIATRYGLDGGDRIQVAARFSAPVQTVPGAHPTSCVMGTGSFPGKSSRGVELSTPPPSSAEANERVELYLCSPLGIKGLYRVTLPFYLLFWRFIYELRWHYVCC